MPKEDQGVLRDRYTIIPRALIFLTQGDDVLLIKGAPNKRLWANRYNGIGGHIEKGEDVLSAANRELYEETGLSEQGLRLCGTITIDTGENTGIGLFVFTGEYQGGKLVESKEGRLEWKRISEVEQLSTVEDLPSLLSKIRSMPQAAPPFSAHYFYDDQGKLVILFNGS